MSKPLTDRQAEVLAFIKRYVAENGYVPTVQELGDGMGITAHSAVEKELAYIEKKGRLRRSRTPAGRVVNRSMRIVE